MQEQREHATALVESLRTQAREFKEQLTATKRDMRRAARTLKTYEVCALPTFVLHRRLCAVMVIARYPL